MNDYPSEDELNRIEQWEIKTDKDFTELMAFVKSIWNYTEWGWHEKNGVYRISTGGWSGNEDIIRSLQENLMFWLMYWYSSRRGGHYVFCDHAYTRELMESGE
jgi:hypothetical protein